MTVEEMALACVSTPPPDKAGVRRWRGWGCWDVKEKSLVMVFDGPKEALEAIEDFAIENRPMIPVKVEARIVPMPIEQAEEAAQPVAAAGERKG